MFYVQQCAEVNSTGIFSLYGHTSKIHVPERTHQLWKILLSQRS